VHGHPHRRSRLSLRRASQRKSCPNASNSAQTNGRRPQVERQADGASRVAPPTRSPPWGPCPVSPQLPDSSGSNPAFEGLPVPLPTPMDGSRNYYHHAASPITVAGGFASQKSTFCRGAPTRRGGMPLSVSPSRGALLMAGEWSWLGPRVAVDPLKRRRLPTPVRGFPICRRPRLGSPLLAVLDSLQQAKATPKSWASSLRTRTNGSGARSGIRLHQPDGTDMVRHPPTYGRSSAASQLATAWHLQAARTVHRPDTVLALLPGRQPRRGPFGRGWRRVLRGSQAGTRRSRDRGRLPDLRRLWNTMESNTLVVSWKPKIYLNHVLV